MCKSEIFAKIINIVSKETEVPVDQILSSDRMNYLSFDYP